MDTHFHNEGGSFTGIHARNIGGDATVHNHDSSGAASDQGDLLTELRRLREQVEQALEQGRLDADLSPIAHSSLDAADKAARADGGVDQGRLRKALRSLAGIAEDVSGVAVAIARIGRLFT